MYPKIIYLKDGTELRWCKTRHPLYASADGRVFRLSINPQRVQQLKPRKLPINVAKLGLRRAPYQHIGGGKNYDFLIHRLVAMAWVKRTKSTRCEVDHIDGNVYNNAASNLDWVTPLENAYRARYLRTLRRLGLVRL